MARNAIDSKHRQRRRASRVAFDSWARSVEPNFEDWKSGTRSFVAMAEMSSAAQPVVVNGEAVMLPGALVSREFFDVMGVRPVVGRGFLPDEQRVGATPAAIVSERLWRTRFNAAPLDSINLRVESTSYVVIGVISEVYV